MTSHRPSPTRLINARRSLPTTPDRPTAIGRWAAAGTALAAANQDPPPPPDPRAAVAAPKHPPPRRLIHAAVAAGAGAAVVACPEAANGRGAGGFGGGGKLNRDSLRHCATMHGHLLQGVLLVIVDQGTDGDWGTMCYPPIGVAARRPR